VPGEDEHTEQTYTQAQLDELVAERNKALEANKNEILAELSETRKRLKAFDGIDPQAVKQMQTKLQELEHQKKADKAGVTSEELNRLRQEVRGDLEKEYAEFKSKAEQAAREIRELRLDSVVKGLMAKNGVRGERVDALFRLTADQFDLTDDGQPMVREKMGTPVDKYVADHLSKEYPEFFVGTGSSGGGASKSAAGSASPSVIPAGDNAAFMQNLDAIAAGKVRVQTG
jgi:hypothetical protein